MATPFVTVSGSGERITSMLAQTIEFAADVPLGVTDGDGVGTKTVQCAGFNRVFLAEGTGVGSNAELDCIELLEEVEKALNGAHTSPTWYTVSLRSDGFVQIVYAQDPTPGDAVITWTGAEALRNILGFEGSSTTLNAANSRTAVATRHPLGVLYTAAVLNSTDWSSARQDAAYAMAADGRVYGWGSNRHLLRKRFDLGFHPRTWSDRTSLGAAGTPAWADDSPTGSSAWLEPTVLPDGTSSERENVHRFLATANALPIAMLLGRFQDAASYAYYEVGYQTPESILADRAQSPTIANYRPRSTRAGFELTFRYTGQRQ
jgi:hypothetical protein